MNLMLSPVSTWGSRRGNLLHVLQLVAPGPGLGPFFSLTSLFFVPVRIDPMCLFLPQDKPISLVSGLVCLLFSHHHQTWQLEGCEKRMPWEDCVVLGEGWGGTSQFCCGEKS